MSSKFVQESDDSKWNPVKILQTNSKRNSMKFGQVKD